ncbi:MAG: YbjN domain-containing protein [Sandaracinaceae bacterium]|nr:YbjN domain-containing protein [Sandaracinaceae bacterium]
MRQHAGARAQDWPELEHAFRAWSAGDAHQMITACLPALRVVGSRHVDRDGVRYWPIATVTSAVFIVFDAGRGEVAVEAPMLRLPERLAVPVLRYLLDANGRVDLGAARYCLRDDVVVLRWARRFASCSPPELVAAIQSVAKRCDQAAEPLAAAYFARPVAPELAQRGHDPALLGVRRALSVLEAGDGAPRDAAPASFGSSPPPRSRPPAAPAARPSSLPEEPRGARAVLREETQRRLADAEHFAALMQEAIARSRLDDPPLAVLIQRAAIFRAAYEFGESLPDAIAVLYGAGRALVERPPRLTQKRGFLGFGGGAEVVSPSILPPVFARLGRDLGDVGGVPPNATPPPFPSVAELKGHLRALLEDLESGPVQPEIKQFVLLGATAETLLRAPGSPDRRGPLGEAYDRARTEPPIRAVAMLRHVLGRVAQ